MPTPNYDAKTYLDTPTTRDLRTAFAQRDFNLLLEFAGRLNDTFLRDRISERNSCARQARLCRDQAARSGGHAWLRDAAVCDRLRESCERAIATTIAAREVQP